LAASGEPARTTETLLALLPEELKLDLELLEPELLELELLKLEPIDPVWVNPADPVRR